MTLRESIIGRAAHAVEQLSVKSALNAMLWLCGLVTIPTVVATLIVSPLPFWLILLACTPVGAATIGFAFLLIFDRDKLQSESYKLRQQALELIEEKGDVTMVDASTIEVISNPDLPALLAPDDDDHSVHSYCRSRPAS